MVIKSPENLNEFQIDVMKELGNIGMGNAATSLSAMLSSKVDMTIPNASLLSKQETEKKLDELKQTSIGIILTLCGDVDGYIIHFLRKSFAERVVNFFFESSINDIADLDEMSMSVISEVGNITSASYVNAIASMTNMFIDISPPKKLINYEKENSSILEDEKKLLYIDNSFFIDDVEVKSNLIFIPKADSLDKIFTKLGTATMFSFAQPYSLKSF